MLNKHQIKRELQSLSESRMICKECIDIESKFANLIKKGSRKQINNFFVNMPKGAVLHAHFPAMVSWSNFLYKLIELNEFGIYFYNPPNERELFKMGTDITFKSGDITAFPKKFGAPKNWTNIKQNLDSIIKVLSSADDWKKLERVTEMTWSLIKRKGIFEVYFDLLLEECTIDNVSHVELKTNIGSLYDVTIEANEITDDNPYGFKVLWLGNEELNLLDYVYNNSPNQHNKKITYSLVLGCHRSLSRERMEFKLDTFLGYYKIKPDIIRGLDIFGEEDKGNSNLEYIDLLEKFGEQVDPDFVFSIHSGETNKINFPVDINIFALLNLNRRVRIGHGLSIWKYPHLTKIIKEKNIHIELAPLSNKILDYEPNLQDHPGFYYYMNDISVSINPDDPSFFGTNVSNDWVAVAKNWNLTLFDIYSMCLNSVTASALPKERRNKFKQKFIKSFTNFINRTFSTNIKILNYKT